MIQREFNVPAVEIWAGPWSLFLNDTVTASCADHSVFWRQHVAPHH